MASAAGSGDGRRRSSSGTKRTNRRHSTDSSSRRAAVKEVGLTGERYGVDSNGFETCKLADDLEICRVLIGLWQTSFGGSEMKQQTTDLIKWHKAGFTTTDVADHYGPAEALVGLLRMELDEADLVNQHSLTKWVPRSNDYTVEDVERALHRSILRMNQSPLECLQFHWWDYSHPGYLNVLQIMQKSRLVRHVALTNFDTDHCDKITKAGVHFVSNQVQFSLIDQRPLVRMVDWCEDNNVVLLCYGTICGGLLTNKYVGKPEPKRSDLNTPSLGKYFRMIQAWGGWSAFQALLKSLDGVANKHSVSIANVATRWVMQQRGVGGVIIGARLGVSEHVEDTKQVFGFKLDNADLAVINAACRHAKDGRVLYDSIGDCGDEYRDR